MECGSLVAGEVLRFFWATGVCRCVWVKPVTV